MPTPMDSFCLFDMPSLGAARAIARTRITRFVPREKNPESQGHGSRDISPGSSCHARLAHFLD